MHWPRRQWALLCSQPRDSVRCRHNGENKYICPVSVEHCSEALLQPETFSNEKQPQMNDAQSSPAAWVLLQDGSWHLQGKKLILCLSPQRSHASYQPRVSSGLPSWGSIWEADEGGGSAQDWPHAEDVARYTRQHTCCYIWRCSACPNLSCRITYVSSLLLYSAGSCILHLKGWDTHCC